MRIVADENVRFLQEAFGAWGHLDICPPAELDSTRIRDADVLIVRSVTRIDEGLLSGSTVRHVASPTSGIDHVDLDYLDREGITFHHAPGSNADAVAQYVLSALLGLETSSQVRLKDKTIAVIGCGEVGSRVARLTERIGLNVLRIDPPQAVTQDGTRYDPPEAAFDADIVTLHVPLTDEGPHATRNLADRNWFGRLKEGVVFINTSRGSVVDEPVLRKAIEAQHVSAAVLDVWSGEPEISAKTRVAVTLGTPHIAGYTVEAKLNGTAMIYDGLCKALGRESEWAPRAQELEPAEQLPADGASLSEIVLSAYDVRRVDAEMRTAYADPSGDGSAGTFHALRRKCTARREFSGFRVDENAVDSGVETILKQFGFRVEASPVTSG